ncbi:MULTISPECIES: hypothetical protein [unclassified Sphingomonas]|uniref:hypothetical protein n=1 Tax=unclassified Sphingomonas TaxID=196159 RepID=UPI00161D7FC5|nr:MULTISPECIES: hypothetical protein [unclassified Sphingomonas]MBB3348921.1 hypothetical protein [Sphingomonas sp. BK069]MBB3472698.1 hypothetical protein [Sphingomonas sp. BK345]
MADPRLPSRRALRLPAILAAFVAALWLIVFVGDDIAHYRSLATQERGGVPRGLSRRRARRTPRWWRR